jgi:hypothetical protein
MSIPKKNFELKLGLNTEIKRIEPKKIYSEEYNFISIQNMAYWLVNNQFKNHKKYVFLPQLYVALTQLTGEGDNWYDDFKGSYSFAFELDVQKNNLYSHYIYHIYHYRSYIDFSVYQRVSKEDKRNPDIIHQPIDELFSDNDICYFSSSFCSYALKYLEDTGYTPEPFQKSSDSNLLLFGYAENEYFIKQYEDDTEYHEQKIKPLT